MTETDRMSLSGADVGSLSAALRQPGAAQVPTKGRIVLYRRPDPVAPGQDPVDVAVVTRVVNGLCNLFVIPDSGTLHHVGSVKPGGPDQPGTWFWPPRA